jgi:hypothetical protein
MTTIQKDEITLHSKSISKKSKVTSLYVKVSELKIHPHYKEIYFKPEASIVKALAADIKEHGLIVLPTVNKNYEILSGTIRIEALMNIGYENIDVIVLDINKEEELKYMIAENHHREKSILVEKNEILALRKHYLKKQGSKGNGEHTNKIISKITGCSTDRIQKIVKIEEQFPDLFDDINANKMSLHSAWEKALMVEENKNLQSLLEIPIEVPKKTSEINKCFVDAVKDLAEQKGKSEYAAMIDKKVIDPKSVLKAIKEEKTLTTDKKEESSEMLIIDMCPFCGAKIKKIEDRKKLNQYSDKILNLRDEIGLVA